ncbi:hypothetical protein RGQ29_019142 [Quercus rubra]|uniref:Receptor-like serine/threonine-protein kinase n=1 Tax=Quercus rubra TaxID=3512 RepID=A0AAN7F9B9_QUERU|nr:hypothetical protein RGQ29_019142 [Quercus rubra]
MAITSKRNPVDAFLFSFFFISYYLSLLSHAAHIITQGQNLSDGQNLTSDYQNFQLGFFSPANSSLRYVGIWYHNIQEKEPSVIWVANRRNPLFDKKGVLLFGEDGNLMVVDGNNTKVWSSNASIISANTTAMLHDTGNLILSSNDGKNHWESFNDPTDTFLPGMRVQVNAEMGENRTLTSWKSASDPSPGNYSMGVDPQASPQIVIWEGEHRRWRSGYWDGRTFSGVPNITSNYMYGFKLSDWVNESGYLTYTPMNSSDKLRFRIRWDGYEEQLRWQEGGSKWDTIQTQPADKECELYNFCGNFGLCNELSSSVCSCMQGFDPVDPDQWNKGNWSGGCRRRTELQCQRNLSSVTQETAGEDGFLDVKCSKLPDLANLVGGTPDSIESCENKCLNNCSCTAYAVASGIGCLIWKGDLLDVHQFPRAGNTLRIRLADSDLVLATVSSISGGNDNDMQLRIYESSKSMEFSTDLSGPAELSIDGDQANGLELPLFNFNCVAVATNNFSEKNKLGEGGFGPVYKGKLPGGQEIAVKRLSVRSCQGLEEFKNEISLIAKLQHRNLVRLLGCSIQGEEKMLLYEYMSNKSLDCFLFDPSKQALLDWRKRFTIIEGIARGLLYLHRDSRLRIIHRDLKASNILLDEEMNPKISDFGMARIFGGNQHEANTNRVVGTFGYMSPEYAMEGLFSVKSDVYSFGVLLLEIVSGRKNTSFRLSEYSSLIGRAWHLWNEEKAMELIDPSIQDSCSRDEVLRCIHLGMLCVQDSASQRPTMSSVVLMLESEGATLPLPRQPTFTSMRESSIDTESYVESQDIVSSNNLTVTMICGR